jgi:hypothetical protein
MSKTREQTVEQAAKFNKLIDTAGTFEASDEAAIDGYFEPLIAQLRVDEVCDVDDEDEIPDEWFIALANLLANLSGPEFGIEYNPQKKATLEAELRRLTSAKPTYETLSTNYY